MANKQMEGQPAPPFDLKDQQGKRHRLEDYAGRSLVLYFYPKDDTPGCTKEACSFRDNIEALRERGAAILGVSPDDTDSHQRFAEKFDLPFPLLADTEHEVAEAYDVWQEKNMYGKRFFGVTRATFLIDGDGIIRKVWGRVKVEGHTDQVLEALDASAAATA